MKSTLHGFISLYIYASLQRDRLGVPTPANTTLYRLIKAVEESYLSRL